MKRPRNLLAPSRAVWDATVHMLEMRGINPETCRDLLVDYVSLMGEQYDLETLWDTANLDQKLKIGRRFSGILREKLRLRELLISPREQARGEKQWERLLGMGTLPDEGRRARAASSSRLSPSSSIHRAGYARSATAGGSSQTTRPLGWHWRPSTRPFAEAKKTSSWVKPVRFEVRQVTNGQRTDFAARFECGASPDRPRGQEDPRLQVA